MSTNQTQPTNLTYPRHHSTQAIDRRGFWGTIKLGAIIAIIIILFAICEGI